MAVFLRQSTASQEIILGSFVDDTDGKTAETALSIANTDIKIWKHGGTTEASKNSGGATHIASGRYYAVLDATDTDTIGNLRVSVHVAGALPVWLDCVVLDEAVFDALFGTTALATTGAAMTLASGAITSSTFAASSGLSPITSGTAQSGSTSTTIKLASGASASDDFYKDQTVIVHTGTGAGQSRVITGYVGSTKVATVHRAWSVTPDATSQYLVLREPEMQSGGGSVSLGTNAPSGWINAAAFAAGAIDAAAIAANAIGASELAADAGAEIATAVRSELTTELARIDAAISTRLASASYTAPSNSDITAIKAKTDQFVFTVANQVDANALSGGGGLDAAGVRAAVGLASANLDTQLTAIVADTNELQADWANGGRLDLILDAVLVDTAEIGTAGAGLTALPWNAAWDAEVQSECNDALTAFTCDTGVTLAKMGEMVAALAAGKVSATSAAGVTTLSYKKRDGSTTSFTTVVTESNKTRATTGALS